ncbi:Asp23/Gls24 family envelope stress response protein [Butyrivibrio sp. MC2013]|uniref:Asp23/Gls24 family envelope stress response protein n=1 Tax=Butyrivibrio sp. MC2013 TaxID=1280686 RepID=UPI00047A5919|nr:Asp23/Gls24 family envelope stress response protein [Butyrivibrio sp. MC2013]
MAKNEKNSSFEVKENPDIGTVKIANDVLAVIAALAALETPGVSSLQGGISSDSILKAGYRKLAKSVRVHIQGREIKAELALIMGYGFNIQATSQKVQTRVKSTIESMTGLNVTDVDVSISGITVSN